MQPNQEIVDLLRFIVRCNPRDLSGAGTAPTDGIEDWDPFLALAEQHRIGPLCHAVLEGTGVTLPVAAAQKLARVRERHSLLNLARAAELLQVLEAFQAAKIDVMPFKGVVLAAQIYGDITLRAAGDLDLFIRWEDLRKAAEILVASGYRLTTPLRPDGRPVLEGCYEYRFERPLDGMVLELHWQLSFVHPCYPHSVGLDWLGGHHKTMRFAGGEVELPDKEATLVLLSMHGSAHVWSRLNWVCDVAQLLRCSPDLDWTEVKQKSGEVGLDKAVALGLLLARSVAGVQVSDEIIEDFDSMPCVRPLARSMSRDFLQRPERRQPGALRYHVRLLDRMDLLRTLSSREILRPTRGDLEFLPLPPSLRWMHVLIRPLRLLFDRSPR